MELSELSESVIVDLLFHSAMKTFTESGNWPAVVMIAYNRFLPELEHRAEWRGDYMYVFHRFLDRSYGWAMHRDVCCPENIKGMVGEALKSMFPGEYKEDAL